MIVMFNTCVDSIRTLPGLQHDDSRAEDVDTEGEDHAPDEIRYACMSRPMTRIPEPSKPILPPGTFRVSDLAPVAREDERL